MTQKIVTAIEVQAQVDRATKGLDKLAQAYRRQQGQIKGLTDGTNRLGNAFTGASRTMSTFRSALGLLGLGTIGFQMREAVNRALEFDRAMINVQKTTDITGSQLEKLGANIQRLSEYLGTSSAELARITGLAGQLGIRGTDSLLKFTATIAKLERATNLVGQEAATQLARVLQLTGTDVTKHIDSLGSVIVELGNNLATTERAFVSIAEIIAPTMKIFESSATDTLSFAAAISSVGIEGQAAATALLRLFAAMERAGNSIKGNSKEMRVFAETIGMTVEETRALIQNDRQLAAAKFLSGLGGVSNPQAVLGATVTDAFREQKALLALANPIIMKSLEMGRAEKADPTELTRETIVQLESTGGRLAKALSYIGNTLIAFGEVIATIVVPSMEGLEWLVKKVRGPKTGEDVRDILSDNDTAAANVVRDLSHYWEDLNETEQRQMRLVGRKLLRSGSGLPYLPEAYKDMLPGDERISWQFKDAHATHYAYANLESSLKLIQEAERKVKEDDVKSQYRMYGQAVYGAREQTRREIDVRQEELHAEQAKLKEDLDKKWADFYKEYGAMDNDTRLSRLEEMMWEARSPKERAHMIALRRGERFEYRMRLSGMHDNMTQPRYNPVDANAARLEAEGRLAQHTQTAPNENLVEYLVQTREILQDLRMYATSLDQYTEASLKLVENEKELTAAMKNLAPGTLTDARMLRGTQIREGMFQQMADDENKKKQAEADRIKALKLDEDNRYKDLMDKEERIHRMKVKTYEEEKALWMDLTRHSNEAIHTLLQGSKDLSDIGKRFLNHIAGLLVQEKITKPLNQLISGAYDEAGRPPPTFKPSKELQRLMDKRGKKYDAWEEAVAAEGRDQALHRVHNEGLDSVVRHMDDVNHRPGDVQMGDQPYLASRGNKDSNWTPAVLDAISRKAAKETLKAERIYKESDLLSKGEVRRIDTGAQELADKEVEERSRRIRETRNLKINIPPPQGNNVSYLDFLGHGIGNLALNMALASAGAPALARGGNVRAAGMALVGEQGPELLNLPRGATVTPLTPSDRANMTGGNQPTNITINVSGIEDPTVFEQVIDRQMPRISEAVKGNIMANVDDNSDFSSATGL